MLFDDAMSATSVIQHGMMLEGDPGRTSKEASVSGFSFQHVIST